MVLARDRDAIAREYATDYETTFAIGAPRSARTVRRARLAGRDR